jgi:hypothetical protein
MPTPTIAPALELLFVAGWLIIPASLAYWLSRRLGVLLGTLTFWAFCMAHPLIAPERYFLGGGASLLLGWLGGFIYSAFWHRVAQALQKSDRLKRGDQSTQK